MSNTPPEIDIDNSISVTLFRLADGTLIDPLTREPVNQGLSVSNRPQVQEPITRETHGTAVVPSEGSDQSVEEPDDEVSKIEAKLEPLARRSLFDITLPKKQMAVICMAIMYKNWGLPDDEIASSIGISLDALDHVRNLDMYIRLDADLVSSLRNSYINSTEGILQQASTRAALRMVRMVSDASSDVAMTASKDVLDRTGHRPADKVEHTMKIEQNLVVRVLRERDEDKHFAELDLEAN